MKKALKRNIIIIIITILLFNFVIPQYVYGNEVMLQFTKTNEFDEEYFVEREYYVLYENDNPIVKVPVGANPASDIRAVIYNYILLLIDRKVRSLASEGKGREEILEEYRSGRMLEELGITKLYDFAKEADGVEWGKYIYGYEDETESSFREQYGNRGVGAILHAYLFQGYRTKDFADLYELSYDIWAVESWTSGEYNVSYGNPPTSIFGQFNSAEEFIGDRADIAIAEIQPEPEPEPEPTPEPEPEPEPTPEPEPEPEPEEIISRETFSVRYYVEYERLINGWLLNILKDRDLEAQKFFIRNFVNHTYSNIEDSAYPYDGWEILRFLNTYTRMTLNGDDTEIVEGTRLLQAHFENILSRMEARRKHNRYNFFRRDYRTA